MPSKRQPSKQRRAAENRARREALAARSARASEPRPEPKADANGDSSSTTTSPVSNAGGVLGWLGVGRGTARQPGQMAVLLSVVFAMASFVAVLFMKPSVDDQGDPLPPTFGGLHMAARSALKGRDLETTTTSLLDAYGPQILVMLAVPALVCVVAFVMFRRSPASKPLTIGMLAMAATVILTGGLGIYYMPSLIAMAVGSFQVRRLELPARQAQARARREARQKDEDEDLEDEDEDEDEELEDEYEDEDFDEDLEDAEDEDEDVEAEYEDAEDEDLEDEEPEAEADKPDSRQ